MHGQLSLSDLAHHFWILELEVSRSFKIFQDLSSFQPSATHRNLLFMDFMGDEV